MCKHQEECPVGKARSPPSPYTAVLCWLRDMFWSRGSAGAAAQELRQSGHRDGSCRASGDVSRELPELQVVGFVVRLFGGEKLFEAECKETLIACSKYDSLPLGLKYVIVHSLLSPGVKLLGAGWCRAGRCWGLVLLLTPKSLDVKVVATSTCFLQCALICFCILLCVFLICC